jgi:anti-sigma factor RsiW
MSTDHPTDDQLIALALDELDGPPAERRRLTAHVAACPGCRSLVAGLERALETYGGASPPAAPAEILVELLGAQAAARAARALGPPHRHWLWRWRPMSAAALLVLIGLLSFWAGRRSAGTASRPPTQTSTERVLERPLPEPPAIPFRTAAATGTH